MFKAVAFFSLAALVAAHPLQLRATGQVITQCTQPNTAALTFDDGPYVHMDQIVDMLDSNGAKGTFFLNGKNFDCIYSEGDVGRIQRTYQKGHQIASHTWSHAHLGSLSKDQVTTEFTLTQTAIEKITGAQVAMTRPPFGEFNEIVQQVAAEQGQALVNWDFDSGDSAGASPDAMKSSYGGLVQQKPKTILTLNHETYDTTIAMLPQAIADLKGAGYKLVTVADCLGMQPYLKVGTAGARDSSWTC
ncbi:hypothetical protein V5O48_002666 [Marasmius crinis-equi]|uniref:NodB homology domain-containing protein n=1 Tax=Marasmius crinis-equi TaxID=585013 RepID=A0ABR3FV06_9AGAR